MFEGCPYPNNRSELSVLKSKFLPNATVSAASVQQKRSFFTLPWHIKLDIYGKLEGGDLINFHLAFPKSTSELAPFYYLKSSFEYKNDALWPVIRVKRVPNPIEEELIHSAYNLTLRLRVYSFDAFQEISDELRCKVTELVRQGHIGRLLFL